MFTKRRGLGLFKAALAAFALAVGPCPNLQNPPPNTELFWGVAIALGAEVSVSTVADHQPQVVAASDVATD